MSTIQKFGLSFILALTLHLILLALFGLGFVLESEPERITQKPVPEIIQASMLDDKKILEEANRLKNNEENKRIKNQKQQQKLANQRKNEQKLLAIAKKKRLEEETKAKKMEKIRRENELKEKQRRAEIKKSKAEEAARLAKIKLQKEVEKKRQEKLREAERKKQELARLEAEKQKKRKLEEQEKAKQALIAKQKAEAAKAAEKAAAVKRQQAAAKAKVLRDKQATVSASGAIQRKVNNSWIRPRPLSSSKGLKCTIRVKLLPGGDVMDATVVKSSGDRIFDRSAENAVRKASPLPVPKDRSLFSKNFRAFTFEFKPE